MPAMTWAASEWPRFLRWPSLPSFPPEFSAPAAAGVSRALRRLRHGFLPALLSLPLLAGAAAPVAAQACNVDGSCTVPADWALKPSGIPAGGGFRLLFLTEPRTATATGIATYNGFVQAAAAGGHAAIRPYADRFRAVGSTTAVSARDNTMTTGAGVPVHWLNGARVADGYGDFWDGSWDAQASSDTRLASGVAESSAFRHWTGSDANGSGRSRSVLGSDSVRYGQWGSGTNPVSQGSQGGTGLRRMLALSPVFRVEATAGSSVHPAVSGALLARVREYFRINRDRADRNHGCNWYRVLIAFGDRTAAQWEDDRSATDPNASCSPLTAYTAAEAAESEKTWRGWKPVRETLEEIEKVQTVTVEPPRAQRAESQQDSAATVSVVFPSQRPGNTGFVNEVSEDVGTDGDSNNCVHFTVQLSQALTQSYQFRYRFLDSESTAERANITALRWGQAAQSADWHHFEAAGDIFTRSISAGGTKLGRSICIRDDDVYESDETVVFEVYNHPTAAHPATLEISPRKYSFTIRNDDPKPAVSISAPAVTEGEDVVVTLTADRAAQDAYDIDVNVRNSTVNAERAKVNIVARKTYTVKMPAYAKTATFNVPTFDDNIANGLYASVGLEIQSETSDPYERGSTWWKAIPASDSGNKTTYTLTVDMPADVTEGDGGNQQTITPTITLDKAASQDIEITIKGDASAGTARPTNWSGGPVWSDGSANPEWDYAFRAGGFTGYQKTITAGATSMPGQTIAIHNDDTYEEDETIGLVVECVSGCSSTSYEVVVVNDATPTKILNNDPKPVATLAGPDSAEEGGTATYTVSLDRKSQIDSVVQVNVSDDSERDYVNDGHVSFDLNPYQTSASRDVTLGTVSGYHTGDTFTARITSVHVDGSNEVTAGTVGTPSSKTTTIDDSSTAVTLVMPDDVAEGDSGATALYPKLVLGKALASPVDLCIRGVDNTALTDDHWARPGNGSDAERDYAFWSGVWNSGTALCSTIPAGVTEYTKDTPGSTYRFRIQVRGDTDPEESELIGVELFCKAGSDCSNIALIQDSTPTRILNDDISDIPVADGGGDFCRQDFPLSNQDSGRNVRTREFCTDGHWKYERKAIREAAIDGTVNGEDVHPDVQALMLRTWAMVALKPDKTRHSENRIDSGVVRNHKLRNGSRWSGEQSERLYRYARSSLGYLEGGASILMGNYGAFDARQCIEDFNIRSAVVCGIGGYRIMVSAPSEAVEGEAHVWLYPSSGASRDLKVRVTETGSRASRSEDVLVPPYGLRYRLPSDNALDERDGDREYLFEAVGGTNWTINPDDTRKTIRIVDDEPTVMVYQPNTLSDVADEGGFPRIAKFAVVKRPAGEHGVGSTEAVLASFWEPADVMTWDFNLGGPVNVQNAHPVSCHSAADQAACQTANAKTVMPVAMEMDSGGTVTKTGVDTFRMTGRNALGAGWTMTLHVGEDTNSVDETLTTDLRITLSQSGGGVAFSAASPFPSRFPIYDDEKASHTVSDNSALNDDTVYVSFTSATYKVSEHNSPAQPVLKYYNKDNDGNKIDLCAPGATSSQFRNCVTGSDGVNISSTTLTDTTPVHFTVTGGTAAGGARSDPDDSWDYGSPPSTGYRLLIIPGKDLNTGKFDITINAKDNDHVDVYRKNLANGFDPDLYDASGDETIEIAMDASRLATGLQVDPDGFGSTVVTILNNESDVVAAEKAAAEANRCDPDHVDYDASADCNLPVIEIESLNFSELAENDVPPVKHDTTFKITLANVSDKTAAKNVNVDYRLEGPCLKGGARNAAVGVSELAPNSSFQTSGFQLHHLVIDDTHFTLSDDADCEIKVSLAPSETGSYLMAGTPKTLVVRDTDPFSVFLNNGRKARGNMSNDIVDYSEGNPLSMALFMRKSLYENGSHSASRNRRLLEGETIEIPVRAKISGAARNLSADDYKITAFEGQGNVEARKLPDNSGYSVKMSHANADAQMNCHSNQAGDANHVNHLACLSLSTALDVPHGESKSIEVYLDHSDGNFGETKTSGGYSRETSDPASSSTVTFKVTSFSPDPGTSYGSQADAKTLSLHARQTRIEEPDPKPGVKTGSREQNWIDIPMDVLMSPGPSDRSHSMDVIVNGQTQTITRTLKRQTHFDFCVRKASTTASYYYDWRIVDKGDHDFGLAAGGYAWDAKAGCTKGGPYIDDVRKRFYLRVFGDSHDEGAEKIAMFLKVREMDEDNDRNVDNVTASPAVTTFTITNDGPLPREHLAHAGHSLASGVADAIAARVASARRFDMSVSNGRLESASAVTQEGWAVWAKAERGSWGWGGIAGDSTRLMLGADLDRGGGSLLGVMAVRDEAESAYEDLASETGILAVVPYVSLQGTWAAAGAGTGDLMIAHKEVPDMTAGADWLFLGAGIAHGEFSGDAFWQRMSSAGTARIAAAGAETWRARFKYRKSIEVTRGLSVQPSVAFYGEGGDIPEDTGIDLGLGASWNRGPWSATVNASRSVGSETDSGSVSGSVTRSWRNSSVTVSDQGVAAEWRLEF